MMTIQKMLGRSGTGNEDHVSFQLKLKLFYSFLERGERIRGHFNWGRVKTDFSLNWSSGKSFFV